jgi:hypothetical protein
LDNSIEVLITYLRFWDNTPEEELWMISQFWLINSMWIKGDSMNLTSSMCSSRTKTVKLSRWWMWNDTSKPLTAISVIDAQMFCVFPFTVILTNLPTVFAGKLYLSDDKVVPVLFLQMVHWWKYYHHLRTFTVYILMSLNKVL